MKQRKSVYDRYSNISLTVYIDQDKLSKAIYTVYFHSSDKKVLTVMINKWGDWLEAHDCDYGDINPTAQELYYARKTIKGELKDLFIHMNICLSQTDYKEEE